MAKNFISNKDETVRMFRNNFLESLSHIHYTVPLYIFVPVIVYCLYKAIFIFSLGALSIVGFIVLGLCVWTLTEYVLHRFVFHWVAESERAKNIVYVLHGNHHHYPRDRERLFMPPVPSLIIASIVFSLMYLLMRANAFMFFPGFLLGYLMYGSMHYAIHAWNPPLKWMKPLWRNHHLHHYKDEHMGFGVSSTLWDHVFGTMFDLKKEKEDKEKVRELMFTKR